MIDITMPAVNEPAPTEEASHSTTTASVYDNNPSYKHRRQYQQQLAKLIKARESGELNTLGRAAIKRYVGCGDDRSASLQTELVELGHAVINGKTVRWNKAA